MKKYIALVLASVCILCLFGCNSNSMDYIIANKPSVTGIVQEVHSDYGIMYSETADGYPNGSNWSIPLNVENTDSYTDLNSMDYIIANKPSVTGIVQEVYSNYVIMYSETADGYPNGSNWSIPLSVENTNSYTDLVVGDEIVVYYDGMPMETDPLQVSTVYAITLKTPADRVVNDMP